MPQENHRWLRPLLTALVVAAMLLPIVVAGLHATGQPWYPASDRALIALRAGDVGSATPLVGAYSRFGWSHPGPLLLYWLAPFARSATTDDRGLLVGTALLNGFVVIVAAVFAYRQRALAGLLVLGAVVVLLMHGFAAGVVDPWNPYAPVMPFACYVVLVWAAANGDVWAWPAIAAIGSFIVQAHVGYAPVVGLLGVWATIGFAHEHWRRRTQPSLPGARAPAARRPDRSRQLVGPAGLPHRRRGPNPTAPPLRSTRVLPSDHPPRPPFSESNGCSAPLTSESRLGRREVAASVACAGIVLLLAWLPPLLQQWGAGGNLSAMWNFFASTPKPRAGLEAGAGLMETQLSWGGPWWTGTEEINPYVGDAVYRVWQDGLVPLVLFVATTACSFWARRDASLLRLQITVAVGVVAGMLAIAGTVGGAYVYLYRWAWVLGAFVWVVIGVGVVAIVSRWIPKERSAAVRIVGSVTATVVIVGLSVVDATRAADARPPDAAYSEAIGGLAAPTSAGLPPGAPVKVTHAGPAVGEVATGLALRLVRNGHPLVVPSDEPDLWGSERTTAPVPEGVQPLVVVTGIEGIGQLRSDPNQRELAHHVGIGPNGEPLDVAVFVLR